MATLFPLNPTLNQIYQGYYWDGNFWKKSGQDTGFGYLEEAALQSTYLTQSSASTNYLTKASGSATYATITNLNQKPSTGKAIAMAIVFCS